MVATRLENLLRDRLAPFDRAVPDKRCVHVGLLGRGIQASLSPKMHQVEGARQGLDYHYHLFDFDQFELPDSALPEMLQLTRELGLVGVNVTHPFKQEVLAHLTDLGPAAASVGAANTVVFEPGRTIGHNTDSWGFGEAFRRHMSGCALNSVLIVGAGGAGAAVAHAMLAQGTASLDLFDADRARAEALAVRLGERHGADILVVEQVDAAVKRADGVINATPVGMDKYPGTPFDPGLLTAAQWLADIIYFPRETELLKLAARRGCKTLPGAGMAVFQAVKSFEHFTGLTADVGVMANCFEELV